MSLNLSFWPSHIISFSLFSLCILLPFSFYPLLSVHLFLMCSFFLPFSHLHSLFLLATLCLSCVISALPFNIFSPLLSPYQPSCFSFTLFLCLVSIFTTFFWPSHFSLSLHSLFLYSFISFLFNFYSYTVNPFLCLVSVQQHYSFSTFCYLLSKHIWKMYSKEISIYVFPEKELRSHSPNFHILFEDLYIPMIGPPILLQENWQTDFCGNM